MIRTIDIDINAANPNLPLAPFQAYVTSPSSVRIRNVPRKIGTWEITSVQLTVNYPDNTSRSAVCKLVAGVWVGTVVGSTATGTSTNGYAITASGTDENGYAVTGYILGKGDVFILATDGTITIGETTYYVHLLDSVPSSPKKGDLAKIDSVWKLYTGSAWESFANLSTVDWSNITNKPSSFTPSSHAATHGSSGTDPITPAAIGAVAAENGDASVAWNEDGNLAMTGGKFVGSFDGEFMAAAWNDYQIDLGGGETADLPEELAAQIGNHNSASDAHSTKFAEKAAQTPTFTEAATRANLAGSGETQETMWGKVKKVITDFIAHLTDAAAHSSLFALKANISDFTLGSFASYVSSLFSSDNTSLVAEIDNGTKSPTSTSAVALQDRKTVTVTPASATLDIDFVAAKGSELRYCELIVNSAPASFNPTFEQGVTVNSSDTTVFSGVTSGSNYLFVFAETAANVWYVTRQDVKSVTITTAS